MIAFRLDRLLDFLTGIELLMAMLWLGLAIFTVALAILMYSHWGQYKPLRKCMAMSLLAHLLLAGYAATVEIVAPRRRPAEQVIHVTLGDGPDEDADPGGAGRGGDAAARGQRQEGQHTERCHGSGIDHRPLRKGSISAPPCPGHHWIRYCDQT